ncbi:MAG: hypothetical protein QXO71_03370 [Candidatus Jordarchaeaceae archaeon]
MQRKSQRKVWECAEKNFLNKLEDLNILVNGKLEMHPIFKSIVVYGTVSGKSRRVELTGSGRSLYNAMIVLSKHPPKQRFVKCSVGEVDYYLDYDD